MASLRVSLVVTTYNWPRALAVVLESIRAQRRMPDEVVIADDGSQPCTAAIVRAAAPGFPCALRHVWQEDHGFRVARSRNLAISASNGDYVLLIDGDMVLHPRFVSDHLAAARPGSFVQGSRALVSEAFTARRLADPGLRPSWAAHGLRRRRHVLRVPLLSAVYLQLRTGAPKMVKTCNQGWWRDDLLALNGFDERMLGWGREDEELALRAWHAGIECRQLRLAGLAYHLHHTERHQDGRSPNDVYLEETRASRATRCVSGVSTHLAELGRRPPPDLRADPSATAAVY